MSAPFKIPNRVGVGLLAGAFAFLAIAIGVALWFADNPLANPDDVKQVARGQSVYAQHCATCHGAQFEGQHNWRERLPSGRMPAPPHDESGHTWHHPDALLFGITKYGLVPGKYAPRNYQSDMPAFQRILSDDDIWAVLAYIKSTWPENIRKAQREMTSNDKRR